jgi:hypothetical protein
LYGCLLFLSSLNHKVQKDRGFVPFAHCCVLKP